jgi:hypothetical protein
MWGVGWDNNLVADDVIVVMIKCYRRMVQCWKTWVIKKRLSIQVYHLQCEHAEADVTGMW